MKILNQHAKSLEPKNEGRHQPFWFWDGGGVEKDYISWYQADFVCWADEMRCLSCILKNNDSSSEANVAIAVCKEDDSVKTLIEKTLPADSFIFPFRRKAAINLKKDGYITVLSDNANISVIVSGYYLSGYEWFHLRTSYGGGQVEGISPGIVKISALSASAETRAEGSLHASHLLAQAEGGVRDSLLAAWFSVMAESASNNSLRNAATRLQVECRT